MPFLEESNRGSQKDNTAHYPCCHEMWMYVSTPPGELHHNIRTKQIDGGLQSCSWALVFTHFDRFHLAEAAHEASAWLRRGGAPDAAVSRGHRQAQAALHGPEAERRQRLGALRQRRVQLPALGLSCRRPPERPPPPPQAHLAAAGGGGQHAPVLRGRPLHLIVRRTSGSKFGFKNLGVPVAMSAFGFAQPEPVPGTNFLIMCRTTGQEPKHMECQSVTVEGLRRD